MTYPRNPGLTPPRGSVSPAPPQPFPTARWGPGTRTPGSPGIYQELETRMPGTNYGTNIPKAAPQRKTIDLRSLSFGVSGPERPYPVYQFSGGRDRLEYPGHNPFRHIPPYY